MSISAIALPAPIIALSIEEYADIILFLNSLFLNVNIAVAFYHKQQRTLEK